MVLKHTMHRTTNLFGERSPEDGGNWIVLQSEEAVNSVTESSTKNNLAIDFE